LEVILVHFSTMSSASEYIRENDKDAMAKFILDEIPDGDASAAISFLEGVIECIQVTRSIKKQRVSDTTTVATDTTKSVPSKDVAKDSTKDGSKDLFTSFYLNDNLDHIIITLGLQFPDDPYLTAYVIGLRGQNVLTIGKKTGTRIKVENEGTRGDDQLRHIFIMGPLKGCIRAYHVSSLQLNICFDTRSHFERPVILSYLPIQLNSATKFPSPVAARSFAPEGKHLPCWYYRIHARYYS
jgi:hypothetical protein